MKVIGFLDSASPSNRSEELTAFLEGLKNEGFDGSNATVLFSWANNDYTLLPQLAQHLAANADIIVAAGGPVSAIEAKKATSTKPIVFTTISDPQKAGVVASNVTGTHGFTTELEGDRIKVLSTLLPEPGGTIGVLANPNRPYPQTADFPAQEAELKTYGAGLGRSILVARAGNDQEIESAFKQFGQLRQSSKQEERIVGVVVTADPFLSSRRALIIAEVDKLNVPAIYQWPSFVEADGALMSYGPSRAEGYKNAGELTGKILASSQIPPVRQTTNFELVISDARAQQLGIQLPATMLGNPVRKI